MSGDLIARLRGNGAPWNFAEIIEALEAGRESAQWLDRIGKAYEAVINAIPDEFILAPPDGGSVPADEAVRDMAEAITRLRSVLQSIKAHGELACVDAQGPFSFTGGKKPATKEVWQFPRYLMAEVDAALTPELAADDVRRDEYVRGL